LNIREIARLPVLAICRGGFIGSGDFHWMNDMAAMADGGG
jgi:hypothetical protein